MRRLLTSAAMFLCSLLTFAQFSGSGSGTESDPYLILNPIQLNQLRNFLNQDGVYFKLMADIDLTEFLQDENPDQGWQPVGNSGSAAFMGILDGNGKAVKGLWIKRPSANNVGFFGYTNGATVKNVIIEASTIEGNECVGGVSGYSTGSTISNCSFSGSVKGINNVGGYVGSSGNNMTLSANTAIVNITGTGNSIGGFIGRNDAFDNLNISGCVLNDGIIRGANNVGGCCGENVNSHRNTNIITNTYIHANIFGVDNVGGICGISESRYNIINLNNCGFAGEIVGSSCVGGLVGKINKTSDNHTDVIQKCFTIGSISATGDYSGGLIGKDSSYRSSDCTNLLDNYHSGPVTGSNYVGGLVGYKKYGNTSNCYSIGSIAGSQYIGGLLGYQEGSTTLKKSVAINTRVTATTGDVNRIVGYNKGTIGTMGSTDENKSYNRTIVINQGVAQDITDDEMNGTGVSSTTLKLKATYVAMGWDFNDIWEIQETECYPYFKTQTAPPVITSQVISGATTVSGKCVDGGTVTLEIDGITQQTVSSGQSFSFTVSPLQAGHEVRVSAKADGKEQSYYTTEVVSFLGKGTEADPYQISTAADLTQVYRKGYYKLMNDIDLSSYISQYCGSEGWESIGRDGSETIYFDGNNHKVTGLWCNSTRDNTGLFSCFANGYIKNLTVETAKNRQVKGGAYTGILIGKLINGEITDCKVSGTVADGTPVGGMIGKLDGGKLIRCQADVTINATGNNSYIGGLAGEVTGDVEECLSNGTLTASGKDSYVGGLIGLSNSSSNVTNSYSNAKTTSSLCAAGLVAYNYGVVDKCYATGDIYSSNYGAGVIGYNDGANAVVRNCVATSRRIDVTYESQSAQSGGYGQRIIGGIKNGAPAPELNNYALKTMQVSVNNQAQKVYDDIMNGAAKTGAELMKQTTYSELGWNFSQTWSISEGESYPSLKNNPASVGKADDTPEPKPEPALTTDDKIRVGQVTVATGKTVSIGINLENKTTDFTAYQFDLTLPTGFTLATDSKGKYQMTKTSRYADDGQSLSASLQDDGTYRVVSFSLSNDKIEGTDGAILNAIVSAGTNVKAGTYEAKIENILFTKTDGTQLKLNDVRFNIVVSNIIIGDANGDGEINVSDIVEIVNAILGKPSAKFTKTAADVNGDGEVNVTDIVNVVNFILSGNNGKARTKSIATEYSTADDQLDLNGNEDGSLSLSLTNRADYVAAQFDLCLSDGQQLESIDLNSMRSASHQLIYKEVARNRYRVIAYSLGNRRFEGHEGAVLNVSVKGTGSVTVDDIIFVTAGQTQKAFAPLQSTTTGIKAVSVDQPQDVYTIDGRLVRKQAASTDGLEKGVYIVNGKKHIVR